MAEQTNYTVNSFKNAHWLVYINGLEIPVISVNTDFETWNFPTATIEMIPHPILKRIGNEDRLQVAIFFLDVLSNATDPTFRLLGEFEVVGWAYNNSGSGRSMQLSCVSHLQIFTQLFFFYMSSVDDIIVGSGAAFATGAHAGAGAKVYYPSSLFIHGLVPKGAATEGNGEAGEATTEGGTQQESPAPSTGTGGTTPENEAPVEGADADATADLVNDEDFIRAPIEFVTNVFKSLIAYIQPNSPVTNKDGRLPASATSVMGRNFFGRWIMRTQFHRRWVALPVMEDFEKRKEKGCFPVVKAVSAYHLLLVLQQNVMQSVGQSSSVWDLLQMIYGNMYMEIVPIPAPIAVTQSKKTWEIVGPLRKSAVNAVTENGIAINTHGARKYEPAITSFVVKPQSVFGLPPRCNVIFPSMIENLMFQENYMAQPTRLYMGETLVTDLLTSAESKGIGLSETIASVLTTGYPRVVQERMEAFITNPSQNTKNFILYAEEFFKGPNTERMNAPPWFFLLSQLTKKKEQTGDARPPKKYEPGRDSKIFNTWKDVIKDVNYLARLQVSPRHEMPALPDGIVYGFIWEETRFKWWAYAEQGGLGWLQSFPSKIQAEAEKNINVQWAQEIDRIAVDFDQQIGESYNAEANAAVRKTREFFNKYSGAYLMNPKNRGVLRAAMKQPEKDGNPLIGLIFGLLYWQNTIQYNFTNQKKKGYFTGAINYNDAIVANSGAIAVSLGKSTNLRTWKDANVPAGIDPSGWIPPGRATHVCVTVLGAWAHFNGGTYGDAGTPTLEDSIAVYEEGEVGQVLNTIALNLFDDTFKLFAKYEFYRQRYAQRTASVSMAFNPYIVPGFPCAIIDDLKNPVHLIGYVNKVSHSMSATGGSPQMRTYATVSFVRTLEEYRTLGVEEAQDQGRKLAESQDEDESEGVKVSGGFLTDNPKDLRLQGNPIPTAEEAALIIKLQDQAKYKGHPAEPVYTVRDAFQYMPTTERIYARLFYGIPDKKVKTPAFFKKDANKKQRHVFDATEYFRDVFKGDDSDFLARDLLLGAATQELRRRFYNEANSYDAAMRYIARPSCSLKEYVQIWHRKFDVGRISGKQLRGHQSYHEAGGGRATHFWSRIYKLRKGPIPDKFASKYKGNEYEQFVQYIAGLTNVNMTDGASGWEPGAGIVFQPGTLPMMGQVTGANGYNIPHPEMRHDWNKVLELYREYIRRAVFLTGKEGESS
jgi:hypothetical protein